MAAKRKDPYRHLINLNFLTKYRELLKVICHHDYFKEGRLGNVLFTPAGATAEVMKRHGLFFRQDGPGTFSLGYSLDPNDNAAIEYITAPMKLTFWMHIDDMYFLNYTNLPFELEDSIYYFNNLDNDKIETADRNLSKEKYVSGEDKIEIGGQLFTYRLEFPMDDVLVQVVNELDEIVYEEQMEGEAASVDVNLTDEPPGKYTLMLDGLEEKVFYMFPPTLKRKFAVIDIFLDKDDFSDYKIFAENGKALKQQYNIYFQTRATRWKYVFIENTPELMHADHQIYDVNRHKRRFQDSFMTFEPPAVEELDNGGKAIVIYSSQQIPFAEIQEQKFKLKTLKGRSKVDWTVDLPCATAKSFIKPDNSFEENSFFSELVVYL